jgi:hypothetical protein
LHTISQVQGSRLRVKDKDKIEAMDHSSGPLEP